jgi:uncharacterized repeat protein (TIGR03803 family)
MSSASQTQVGIAVLFLLSAIALPAQTYTVLHSFAIADGENPYATLVQGTDGNLYGTTAAGGANHKGTIFKISPSGTLTRLYSFCSLANCADGEDPTTGVIQATNGDFYGTTAEGGTNGDGTVFKISQSGAFTTLYSFCSQTNCADGERPNAGLLQAANGDLYGTTANGGANGDGTIFVITPAGALTTFYSFCSQSGCADGANPEAGLIQGTNGDLYGTTSHDGAHGPYGGTAFSLARSGALTTLYSFGSDIGAEPEAGLTQGLDGNFYGTTVTGGFNGDAGAVFQLTPSGAETTIYSFCAQFGPAGCADGYAPEAGLVQGTDGNFYSTTYYGGLPPYPGFGIIYKITSGGTLTILYSFCVQSGCTDGEYPRAGLVQATNGVFYGTTTSGGANGLYGTVFSLSMGLGPFVKTLPAAGPVGSIVRILGTDLTGATGVSFNGTAAPFTVISNSEIAAKVPAGATSGTIRVITPSGTLSSNVPFPVLP